MNLFFLIMTHMKNFTTTSQLLYLKLATNFSSDSSVMVPMPCNQGLVACCLLWWWIQLSDMSKNVKCWSQAHLEAGVVVGSSCNMILHSIITSQLHIHCAFHLYIISLFFFQYFLGGSSRDLLVCSFEHFSCLNSFMFPVQSSFSIVSRRCAELWKETQSTQSLTLPPKSLNCYYSKLLAKALDSFIDWMFDVCFSVLDVIPSYIGQEAQEVYTVWALLDLHLSPWQEEESARFS